MKTLPVLFLISFAFPCLGQEQPSFVRMQGTVWDPDSIPVENAYLISYETLRSYATDKNGKFDILIANTDSLKLNHLSFKPVILHTSRNTLPLNIYMVYEENAIDEVSIRLNNTDEIRLKENVAGWLDELQNEYYYTCPVGPTANPYAPTKTQSTEASVNIFEVIKWIKYKRKHKTK